MINCIIIPKVKSPCPANHPKKSISKHEILAPLSVCIFRNALQIAEGKEWKVTCPPPWTLTQIKTRLLGIGAYCSLECCRLVQ
jgi:hypothetical protein